MSRQESHRIYLQVFAPRGNNVNDTQNHPTSNYASSTTTTTSAAVRLTDKARTQDVTALLRGKFGLPRILNNDKEGAHSRETYPSLQKRLSHSESSTSRQYSFHHSDSASINNTLETTIDEDEEIDALVLIGTIDRPPKGYLRFEHEESIAEKERLRLFQHHNNLQQQEQQSFEGALKCGRGISEGLIGNHQLNMKITAEKMSHLPRSEPPTISKTISESNSVVSTDDADGDDLKSGITSSATSSRSSKAGVCREGWTTLASELPPSTQKQVSTNESTQRKSAVSSSPPKIPTPCYDHGLDPIHLVRTIHPNEHPLTVRDEMITLITKKRQEAEEEMGYNLGEEIEKDFRRPQPTFRFYFQPSSPLGGSGPYSESTKMQSIPAYVDLEGYCTEDDGGESDHEDEDDLSIDEVSKEELNNPLMQQMSQERRRVAILQNVFDPAFLVSGYLLKQSQKDPNVWRRVYCVLSEDRLWFIGRMRPLSKSFDDILSSIRVGRHKSFKLHRATLIQREQGSQQPIRQCSSSRSGYYLTPLNNRIPNTFRVVTSQGRCHTFRAFNDQSFRVWTTSLSEKIEQKNIDGLLDLAHVISEEETIARSKRMDDIAVAPLVENTTLYSKSTVAMDIVRFGIAVASYRELNRHITGLINNHHGGLANARGNRAGGGKRGMNMEYLGMVSAAWEEARVVASKSAQLLHALASLEHYDSDTKILPDYKVMEELIEEQKSVQSTLGKHWDNQKDDSSTSASMKEDDLALPPIQLFDDLLGKLQRAHV